MVRPRGVRTLPGRQHAEVLVCRAGPRRPEPEVLSYDPHEDAKAVDVDAFVIARRVDEDLRSNVRRGADEAGDELGTQDKELLDLMKDILE